MTKSAPQGSSHPESTSTRKRPSMGPAVSAAGNDPVQLKQDVQAFVRVFRQEVTNVREGIINQDNHMAIDALNYMDEMVDFLDKQTRY